MYEYPWYHWITFFYIYCFFGWIFESTYVSLKNKAFINRGFLRLPMLPLYGSGAIMMLWISLPVRDNIPLLYLFGVIGATVLEYLTGYGMELLFKVRYWDYSSNKFNLNGYICLSSSLAWGGLTVLMTHVLHQPVESLVLNLPLILELSFLLIVSGFFIADSIQSVKAALNLAQILEQMTRIRSELEFAQEQLVLLKEETTYRLNERAKKSRLKAVAFAHTKHQKTARFKSVLRQKLTAQVQELAEKRQSLTKLADSYQHRILRSNPSATSARFADALKELRDIIDHYHK